MKKGTLPPSRDAREVDPAPLPPLIDGASGRAMQPAEAPALSRLVRIAQGDTSRAGALPTSCCPGGTPRVRPRE
jgi:hypothetical protein